MTPAGARARRKKLARLLAERSDDAFCLQT
jgi:hypothetical protein